MKTAPTNMKIRQIISMVKEGKIIPQPEFQRRLVWTRDDKNHFLDSILGGYPFPEIYLADGNIDVETGQGTQLLVDGLQRVSTMIQYFHGDTELKLTTVPAYRDLLEDDKKAFLQYDVAVRDLGSLSRDQIIEVFKRLNATKYSLAEIEVNNAIYAGALKKYAEKVAAKQFFVDHGVFSALDYKRMGDLRFALLIVITIMEGYFNRDDDFKDFLERYNDDFPLEADIEQRLQNVLDLIDECGFPAGERVWRKADLFTLIIEVDQHVNNRRTAIQPSELVERAQAFFKSVGDGQINAENPAGIYYKAALQASNDRGNRLRRGIIMASVLVGTPTGLILQELQQQRLI